MTNPLCECPVAGYCRRHQMDKNETFHALCHGDRGQAGWKYFVAWESGKMGAVSPHDANLNPPPFEGDAATAGGMAACNGCGGSVSMPSVFDRIKSAAGAAVGFLADGMQVASDNEREARQSICKTCPLNEAGSCVGCGCVIELKTQARLEQCPAGRWFPEIRAANPITDPIRNLIYHVLPVARNSNWKRNLDQLVLRQDLFNGKRVLAIAYEPRESGGGRIVQTVQPDEVLTYCDQIGMNWTDSRAFVNNTNLGEVVSFPWLLEKVKSTNLNEVTFYAHAKGVTHSDNHTTLKWAERQYRVCLDDWAAVQRALEQYSIAGSFRRFGEFSTPGNHRWHFSGTFYWFRNNAVFSRIWNQIDRVYFGVEAWPGKMFKPEESACLFADNAGGMCLETEWEKLQRQIDVWEFSRQ